jgi:tRNA pseudouridine38-40 synthase
VLAEVGRGKMPLNDVKKFLHAKSDEPAKLTAPPSGLFLERVYYKGDVWLKDMKPMMEINSRIPMPYKQKHHDLDQKPVQKIAVSQQLHVK